MRHHEDGDTVISILDTSAEVSSQPAEKAVPSASSGLGQQKSKSKCHGRSLPGRSFQSLKGKDDMVNEWLRSDIDKNKAIQTHLELKNRKLLLEIKKLEKIWEFQKVCPNKVKAKQGQS